MRVTQECGAVCNAMSAYRAYKSPGLFDTTAIHAQEVVVVGNAYLCWWEDW